MCHIDTLLKNRFESARLKKTINAEEAALSGAAIIAHHVAKEPLLFSSSPQSGKYFALQEVSSHSVVLEGEVILERFSKLPTPSIACRRNKRFLSEGDQPRDGVEIARGQSVFQTCEGVIEPGGDLAKLKVSIPVKNPFSDVSKKLLLVSVFCLDLGSSAKTALIRREVNTTGLSTIPVSVQKGCGISIVAKDYCGSASSNTKC